MYSIYKITNRDTGRTYIGMTEQKIHDRFRRHMSALRKGNHVNPFMQSDWYAGHSFTVVKLAVRKHKEVAHALETKLMNLEDNPYNIAMGNPGDMAGYLTHRFTDSNRPYMYAEIKLLADAPSAKLQERYHISQPMVSMIKHGHRTAAQPQTSFADVLFCADTQLSVSTPPVSNFRRIYMEYAS